MDRKKVKKLVRLFFLIFNLSCVASIIEIYFRISPRLDNKLFNVFQTLKFGNVLIVFPAMPMAMIITISIFLIFARYIYKLIIAKI
jgi:hypothetical protein